MSRYDNLDLDKALPEPAPEVIAATLTPDKAMQDKLCARLRRHWLTSSAFRQSFRRKDCRDVCLMWLSHWHAAELARKSV